MRFRRPPAQVEVFQGDDGRWYFHKVNRNGKITEPSQGYKTLSGARRAASRDIPGVEVVTVR